MDRNDLILERVRSKNREQLEYAIDELRREFERISDVSTGSLEVKLPFLKGAIGHVTTTMVMRQPDR